MSELKKCPFCKSSKLSIQVNDRSPNLFPFAAHVLCLDCLASVGSHGFEQTEKEARAKAITAWNHRAQPANDPLTLEQLRGMDGEPVWLKDGIGEGWFLAGAVVGSKIYFCEKSITIGEPISECGKTWLAYRTKPERSEG